MKGIILAGGTGSRLNPLTRVTNKHLLPVYNKPMIYYPVETLVRAGIKDIMIVSGKGHAGHFLELLKSGEEFGAKFSYGSQEKAGGIAQALGLCEDFSDNDKIIVILGDNILQDDLGPIINEYRDQKKGAKILLKEVKNPQSFGVANVENNKIIKIEEKPENPKSNLAVIGVYMYDSEVWQIVRNLKPSARGELEITDVNNHYVEKGEMTYNTLKGWWGDCGESFDSLLLANNLVANWKENHCS